MSVRRDSLAYNPIRDNGAETAQWSAEAFLGDRPGAVLLERGVPLRDPDRPLQDQETMGALFLDVRNRLIGESDIFRGTMKRAAVEPRAILKEALLSSASSIILFHTHPSGDPSPSSEDLTFTRRACGDFEGGFARVYCDSCCSEFLVAFSRRVAIT